MKLIDFLIHVLDAHAKTLQRLAAFFGEEELLQMLEVAGELSEQEESKPFTWDKAWFEEPQFGDSSAAYMRLESAVNDMRLSAVLEFHLWAYPFYRSVIESSLDLRASLKKDNSESGEKMIQEAMNDAKEWIRKLPVHPELSSHAERVAQIPWIRFRAEVLKQIGKRRFVTV